MLFISILKCNIYVIKILTENFLSSYFEYFIQSNIIEMFL